MLAFLVAGVVLGVLARVLRSGPDDPAFSLTVPVGVVGAVLGGVGMNLVLSQDWASLDPWSFTMACVLALVLLGLLEGKVGMRS
jgi:uncharacterized membrane protein YeaQ/YmgE (transglycosylase-associated protein family)